MKVKCEINVLGWAGPGAAGRPGDTSQLVAVHTVEGTAGGARSPGRFSTRWNSPYSYFPAYFRARRRIGEKMALCGWVPASAAGWCGAGVVGPQRARLSQRIASLNLLNVF